MQRFQVIHETTYTFSDEVELGPHKLLVRPREGHDIRIGSSALQITPPAIVKWHRDELDNSVAIANFSGHTRQLVIASEITIEHYDEWPLDFLVEDYAVQYPFAYANDEHIGLTPYLNPNTGDSGDRFESWVARFNTSEVIETYTLLTHISQAIVSENQYTIREEPGVQSPERTLELGSGSCRDFAWLFMATARRLGLATRFVSGYLHTPANEFDYGATHAWAEVYLPGAGWKGFDPTSHKVTGTQYIPTAVAIYPESVPPVSGSFTGPHNVCSELTVKVQVKSI